VLAHWLADGALHAPYAFVAAATILWFLLIYAAIAGGAYLFALDRVPDAIAGESGRTQRLRPGQLREELLLSGLSILVFAAQAVGLVWMLRQGWVKIAWDRPLWHLLWEMPLLYVWNEVWFLAVHRLLHWPPLYRSVHLWHHRSVVTTPFTAYSFHPAESFLLGAVMPLALLVMAFSPWALLGLTLMSLSLNVSGHLPHEHVVRGYLFILARAHSRYHNVHHREFRTHYAFSAPFLDRWIRP